MEKVRLDQWLWAARFYKTRSLSKTAINSGKVKVNGKSCKPSKEIVISDEVLIRAKHFQNCDRKFSVKYSSERYSRI